MMKPRWERILKRYVTNTSAHGKCEVSDSPTNTESNSVKLCSWVNKCVTMILWYGSNISKTSASVSSPVPNTEKIMKSRGAKPRGLYCFRGVWIRWWNTKHEFLIWLLNRAWEFFEIINLQSRQSVRMQCQLSTWKLFISRWVLIILNTNDWLVTKCEFLIVFFNRAWEFFQIINSQSKQSAKIQCPCFTWKLFISGWVLMIQTFVSLFARRHGRKRWLRR